VNILILSDQYLPSTRSSSILIDHLIWELLKKKDKVTLITSTPNSKKFSNKNKNLKIIRVNIFSWNKKNFILKGINQIFLMMQIILILMKNNTKFDKAFIYCPPLFLGLISLFIKNTKKIVNIQDFFPQNAIDLGILKNKLIILILRRIEKLVYTHNDFILVNSLNSKKYLIQKYPELKKKIIFNYNWTKIKKIKTKKFKKNKIFKFVFGGSLGPAQNLERLLPIFKKLIGKCELHIYGDGITKDKLKEKVIENEIKNIKIYKTISNSKFVHKLQEYDSGLIVLNELNQTPFIPGKFNFYCSNGKNSTAIVHKQCDLNQIINREKIGFVTCNFNDVKLYKFFKKILKSKNLKSYDLNAKKFAIKNLDVKYIANKIHSI
jgi:glycosyltransferase involved in cell wall biosynthesis